MKKLVLFQIICILFISCNGFKGNVDNTNQDYLIFGHFYGRCLGENCIRTFKLTRKELHGDTLNDYEGKQLNFVKMEAQYFAQVKDLWDQFPEELFQEKETVIGCPDCADGGGLFIQYSKNGKISSWRIDQSKENVPSYLHAFMDLVNAKIESLVSKGK